jgi:hypothetical protein
MSCNCLEPVIFSLDATTSQAKVGFSCLNGQGSQKYLNFRANGSSYRSGYSTNNPQTWTDDWTYNTTKQSRYIYMVQEYGIITVYEDKNFIYQGTWDIYDGDSFSLYTDATLTTNPPRIQCEIVDEEDPVLVPVVIAAEDVITGPTEAGLLEAEFCTPQIINCQYVGRPASCRSNNCYGLDECFEGSCDGPEISCQAGTAAPTCGNPCDRDIGCTNGRTMYYNYYNSYDCRFSASNGYEENKETFSNFSNRALANEVTDDFVYQICKESTTKKIEKLKTNIIGTCEPLTNPDENWSSFSNGIVVSAKVINNIPTAQQAIFRVCVPKENVDKSIEVKGKFYLYIGATCASCCLDEDNFGGTIVASESITIYPASDPVMTKGGIEYFYKDVQITYDNDTYSQYAYQTINACFTLFKII